MAELKTETVLFVAIVFVVAFGFGLSTIPEFPTVPTIGCGGQCPKALIGLMSASEVTCSYSTGTCTMTLVNTGTVPVRLVACDFQVVLSSNKTATTWGDVYGKVGGPAANIAPANSKANGTCTMPAARLVKETNGTAALGLFTVELLENWGSVPVGNEASFGFGATWS